MASGDQQSTAAGIPHAFLEDTYIHPGDCSVRPNPLKYALSLLGRSTVTRDPILTQGRSSPGWGDKIDCLKTYHQEISYALQQSTFTSKKMEELASNPQANSTTFSQKQKDDFYQLNFNGLLEQAHDKFRCWVGLDMVCSSRHVRFDVCMLTLNCRRTIHLRRLTLFSCHSTPTWTELSTCSWTRIPQLISHPAPHFGPLLTTALT